ncbi:hypothetical protein [Streptomyces europaeiscabiei]|uniref:hypothetical protein n=1 Tax=Streptomyces europaeiscabiei TaxID=146819 RepID=UPI0013C40937|nr:hypothetical protein [Streptomyces europaeiscabiei]
MMDLLVFLFADLTAPAAISLALAGWALGVSVLYLTHDAALVDFDPRPAVSRAVESGRLDSLLVTVANARYDARELAASAVLYARLSLRDAAFTAAALLALLTITPGDAR